MGTSSVPTTKAQNWTGAEMIAAFPAIAAQRIRDNGSRAEFEMTARDDAGHEVMRASLSFALTQV